MQDAVELTTILDTMADGLFVIDAGHAIRRWNQAMERLTGYAASEALGSDCSFLCCGEAGEGSAAQILDCDLFASGMVTGAESRVRRKDGSSFPAIVNGRVMKDPSGVPTGAVVTVTDASPLKQLEEQVSHLLHEVEERFEFHNLVGKSVGMQEVFQLAELAAASQATVLLSGETGTGKELVAKAIHYHSDRKDGPLVTMNCSALSESLLESELFGHVRGAFTGAVKDHAGRFEAADGGTIFLDEIGEISPLVQVKLLRVLQERQFERVGESTTRRVDVRVIAATNRDLRAMVQRGQFREDLFYRLKVFPIALPPLRERKEDVDLLVKRFIARFNEETGKRISGFTPEAMRIMMDYCWPGNVRELENAIEHAFVTCPEGLIGPQDLPVEIRRAEWRDRICANSVPGAATTPAGAPGPGNNAPRARRRPVGRKELERLLDECGWNKAEVARRLGLTRTTVWRRMKALGMPLEPQQ